MIPNAYCPLCSKGIQFKLPKDLGPKHYFQVGFTSVLLIWLCWPIFGMKGFVIFLPCWVIFEVIFRFQKRQQVICGHCGFDPVLYRRDKVLARKKVEEFWDIKLNAKALASEDSNSSEENLGDELNPVMSDSDLSGFESEYMTDGSESELPEMGASLLDSNPSDGGKEARQF